jgi:hypothetical protein
MAAELPPSRLKTTGSLASLRRLMGWQAPGLACKVKNGAVSLANMRLGDFVFFPAYALAGLVLPLSFFLTLLEYYVLQLQQLSVGHLCPPLRDVCGGTGIGVAVSMLLRAEGCEHTPAAHRRSLLLAPDTGPRPLHRACFPWQVGTVERRLGAGAGGRP